jgi:hypothetical protein
MRITMVIVSVAILSAAFYQRAASNLSHIDYRNSNFVFFWLSGRMILSGQNPYDSSLWLAAHDENGVTWRPNLIFPYPLPLAALVAPLGLLSLSQAYLYWQLLSLTLMALVCWFLLSRHREVHHTRFFVPLVLVLLFFGPVLLSLQIGALGAFTLAAVFVALAALEGDRPLLAGLALSLTLLKPPQGIPILFLIAIWLLARREWKAIAGIGLGALGLLLLGMLIDPHWLSKFGTAGQAVMDRTLGLQSNAFGFAYHACAGGLACMWGLGGAAAALTLGFVTLYLTRRSRRLGPWEAINVILPAAFFSTLYLWSYDQILYIIPMIWIILRLTDRTHSYLAAFGFLALILAVAFLALWSQANTRSDLLSVITTILILTGCLMPGLRNPRVTAQGAPA